MLNISLVVSIVAFVKHRHLRTEKNSTHMVTICACGLRTLVDLISDVFHEFVKLKSDQIKSTRSRDENETSIHSYFNSEVVFEPARNDHIIRITLIFSSVNPCGFTMTEGRLHTRQIEVKMSQKLRNGYHLVSINPHGLIYLF